MTHLTPRRILEAALIFTLLRHRRRMAPTPTTTTLVTPMDEPLRILAYLAVFLVLAVVVVKLVEAIA